MAFLLAGRYCTYWYLAHISYFGLQVLSSLTVPGDIALLFFCLTSPGTPKPCKILQSLQADPATLPATCTFEQPQKTRARKKHDACAKQFPRPWGVWSTGLQKCPLLLLSVWFFFPWLPTDSDYKGMRSEMWWIFAVWDRQVQTMKPRSLFPPSLSLSIS